VTSFLFCFPKGSITLIRQKLGWLLRGLFPDFDRLAFAWCELGLPISTYWDSERSSLMSMEASGSEKENIRIGNAEKEIPGFKEEVSF